MKGAKELVTKKDLRKVEEKLTKKIDRNSAKIDRNSAKIDSLSKSLDRVAIQVLKNAECLEKTATKEDLNKVAIQVVKNSQAISKMVTKEEFNQKFSELSAGQEEMMTFSKGWIKNVFSLQNGLRG